MKKLIPLLTIILLISYSKAYGNVISNDYNLIVRNITQSTQNQSQSQKIRIISKSKLTYKKTKNEDIFEITPVQLRMWLTPLTKIQEEKGRIAGTPLDGTPFTPNPSQTELFTFSPIGESQNQVANISKSNLGTIDIINLIFYKGISSQFLTENIAILTPKNGKKYEFRINEHDISLFIYWYDILKSRKEKEAPTFLIIVKDQNNQIIASRLVYQVIKTTIHEITEYDFGLNNSDINLDKIVTTLNNVLNEDFKLRVLEWNEHLPANTLNH